MSVWYTVNGTIEISKHAKCSVKDVLKTSIDPECSPEITKLSENADTYRLQIYWTNSMENIEASKEIQRFIHALKSFDQKVKVELESNIRWLV